MEGGGGSCIFNETLFYPMELKNLLCGGCSEHDAVLL